MGDAEKREAQAICGFLLDRDVASLFDMARVAGSNLIIEPGEAVVAMNYADYQIRVTVEVERSPT